MSTYTSSTETTHVVCEITTTIYRFDNGEVWTLIVEEYPSPDRMRVHHRVFHRPKGGMEALGRMIELDKKLASAALVTEVA